jgi:Cysteine rich repeat
MNNSRIVSIVFLSTMFIFNFAHAEGEKLKQKLSKGAITLTANIRGCDDDAKKYCPGLNPNSQKAFMCMMAYEDKLSDSCRLGITEAAMSIKMGAAAIEYSVRACEADADKYCLDVQPGNGQIVSCLRKHEAEISKDCVRVLKNTGLWNMGAK